MLSSPPKEISHPLAVSPHPAQLLAIWGFLMKDFFFYERTQKFSADPQRTSPQARPTGISLEDEGPAPTRGQHLWRRLCKGHASSPEEGSAMRCCAQSLSCVWLFATPWTAARQAPPSMGILQARILEWVAMPSSRGSSWPRDQTQVSRTAGWFFTSWATRQSWGALKMWAYSELRVSIWRCQYVMWKNRENKLNL